MIVLSDSWTAAYPEAHAGFLAMDGVSNPAAHAGLDERKAALQGELRARLAGQDRRAIEALAPIRAYDAYYKRFKKSYHVQGQLESVAFKGRDLPGVAALVEAMFMAELKNLLLTAGHDLDALRLPVTLGAATGAETYTLLRGQDQACKPGDLMMSDRDGVISSILYGPDRRTQIAATTRRVLFAVYAVPGIPVPAVTDHLRDIEQYVRVVSPGARVELLAVYGGA